MFTGNRCFDPAVFAVRFQLPLRAAQSALAKVVTVPADVVVL